MEELYHMRLDTHRLRAFLAKQKMATLEALKRALGTSATMTVFRRLKLLRYRTSYSHRGRYYTLADIPRFDEQGLWRCRGVGFSRHGNLLATARWFVEEADAGLTASELEAQLGVVVKEPLLELVRRKQLEREKRGREYVYFSREPGRRREQQVRRASQEAEWEVGASLQPTELSEERKAAIILFFSLLDQRQRRLYAGLEAHRRGHGGDRQIADFLGLNVHTVAWWRRELFGGQVERGRIRQAGGGRKPAEKKRRSDRTDSPSARARNGWGSDRRAIGKSPSNSVG